MKPILAAVWLVMLMLAPGPQGVDVALAPGSRAITSLSSTDFADLAFLKPLLAHTRIVQIGESGHGMAESDLIKVRLVRFLHQELGFNVVAFESSFFLCAEADRTAAQATPTSTLTSGLFGVWHTQEVLPLFEFMRADRATSSPLRLVGFDVQPIGSGRRKRPAFFQRIVAAADATYGQQVADFDTAFLVEYDKSSTERRNYFRANRAALLDRYGALAAFIDRNLTTLQAAHGRHDVLVARQEARSVMAYVRSQSDADAARAAEARDEGMAENVAFIAGQLFPAEKIVVWGHNYHLQHANETIVPRPEVFPGVPARSMGGWLKAQFKDALYTIGLFAYEGRAVDNSRQPYDIAPPEPGSLERRIGGGDAPAVFADFAEVVKAGLSWPREPVTARYNGQFTQSVVPSRQYDAVIVLRRVTPPVFLY